MRVQLLALALLLAAGSRATAQEEAAGPVRYQDATGKYGLALPAAWKAQLRQSDKSVLDLAITGTNDRYRGQIVVLQLEGMGDPRASPGLEEKERIEQNNASHARAKYVPLPHLVVHGTRNEEEFVWVYTYRRIRGVGFTIFIYVPRVFYDSAEKELLAAAISFTADVEAWPPVPKGYKEKEKGSFLLLIHPGVKAKTGEISKLLGQAEKAFRKRHGKAKTKPDRPIQVLVHVDREAARPIYKRAAEATSDWTVNSQADRLFMVPLNRNPREAPGYLIEFATRLLFTQRYGTGDPRWAMLSEGAVARIQFMTGKKLPQILDGWYRTLPSILVRLDELDELDKKRDESFWKQSAAWGAFFRAGPAKYKKAYKAFLKDYGETGDGKTAEQDHLRSLDLLKMKDAATKFVRTKLREVKAR